MSTRQGSCDQAPMGGTLWAGSGDATGVATQSALGVRVPSSYAKAAQKPTPTRPSSATAVPA